VRYNAVVVQVCCYWTLAVKIVVVLGRCHHTLPQYHIHLPVWR